MRPRRNGRAGTDDLPTDNVRIACLRCHPRRRKARQGSAVLEPTARSITLGHRCCDLARCAHADLPCHAQHRTDSAAWPQTRQGGCPVTFLVRQSGGSFPWRATPHRAQRRQSRRQAGKRQKAVSTSCTIAPPTQRPSRASLRRSHGRGLPEGRPRTASWLDFGSDVTKFNSASLGEPELKPAIDPIASRAT